MTPIYKLKKGLRSDPGNYRPVSLTSIVYKLMESIIRDNVMTHFKLNHLFTNKQFGFIKCHSASYLALIADTRQLDRTFRNRRAN